MSNIDATHLLIPGIIKQLEKYHCTIEFWHVEYRGHYASFNFNKLQNLFDADGYKGIGVYIASLAAECIEAYIKYGRIRNV